MKVAVSPSTNHLTHVNLACLEICADHERRCLYLVGDIDEDSAKKFIVAIRLMDLALGDITVFLQSSGGNEDAGYAIADSIRLARNKVTVVAYTAMSMAALVLQAADRRVLTPEAKFLIHNGTVSITSDGEGNVNADQLARQSRETQKSNRRYQEFISARSDVPLSEVKRHCEEETLFYAEEAVALGFADEILKPNKESTQWRSKKQSKRSRAP